MSVANAFLPLPGRFGLHPDVLAGKCTTTVASSGATTFNFGGHPATCVINRAMVSAGTIPASASALTGVLQKFDKAGNAAVTLTSAINLLTLVAHQGTALPVLSTVTTAQKTLNPGDTVRFVVTAAGTVTTQPVDLQVNVELLVQN